MSETSRVRSMGSPYRPMQEDRSSRRSVLWLFVVVSSVALHALIFGAGQFATTGRLTRAVEVIVFDSTFTDPPEAIDMPETVPLVPMAAVAVAA